MKSKKLGTQSSLFIAHKKWLTEPLNNKMKTKDIVYEFIYNYNINEGGSQTMSIHRTRKGARKAMKEHKEIAYKEWLVIEAIQKKEYIDFGYRKYLTKFGKHEYWGVNKIRVLP